MIQNLLQLVYLVGYADQGVLEMDDINYEVYQTTSSKVSQNIL